MIEYPSSELMSILVAGALASGQKNLFFGIAALLLSALLLAGVVFCWVQASRSGKGPDSGWAAGVLLGLFGMVIAFGTAINCLAYHQAVNIAPEYYALREYGDIIIKSIPRIR